MVTINIGITPKRYFPFNFRDDTMPLPENSCKVLTSQIRPSGHFGKNIVDFFYNEKLELGETFSVRMPTPVLKWHLAKKGTTSRFRGHLDKIFPELKKLSDKALDRLIEDMRDREG